MHGWNWPKCLTGICTFLWFFIGATSAVDAYLTVRYAEQMNEENPIGAVLIEMGPRIGHAFGVDARFVNEKKQDVSLLVGVKMFGTIVVLGFLLLLLQKWPAGGQIVILSLALFQFCLMVYMFQ